MLQSLLTIQHKPTTAHPQEIVIEEVQQSGGWIILWRSILHLFEPIFESDDVVDMQSFCDNFRHVGPGLADRIFDVVDGVRGVVGEHEIGKGAGDVVDRGPEEAPVEVGEGVEGLRTFD